MSKLLYIAHTSLDGYIEDENGSFDWASPDLVFDFITELVRPIATHLYGRRLYETMAFWDAPLEEYAPQQREFARVWQQTQKIVFSRTKKGTAARNTRIEATFDPDAIRMLKRESEHDLFIGGAELAGCAFDANLVDECHLFVHSVIVGGGKPAFRSGLRRNLDLLETQRFGSGTIYARYRPRIPHAQ